MTKFTGPEIRPALTRKNDTAPGCALGWTMMAAS
jgi:hypothetical protein